MPTSSIDQISPPVGPNIVRAWFETAINPVLLGLENEQNVLSRHTYTWREHNGQMTMIRSVWEHVPYGKWANLEQFLSFYPEIEGLCKTHDTSVADLAQACQRVFDALVESSKLTPEFRFLLVKAYESDQLDLTPGHTREDFKQAFPFENMLRKIAEHVINGSGPLGPQHHYGTAAVWNPFRAEFLAFRMREPIVGFLEDVDVQARKLWGIVDKLISGLKDARNSLSLRFDVPPQPLDERE